MAVVENGLPVGGNPNDPALESMAHRHNGLWNITFCDGHVFTPSGGCIFFVKPCKRHPSS